MFTPDHQRHAYVLHADETAEAPALRAALQQGARIQEILCSEMRAGRSGNEVLAAVRAKALAEGIQHELGCHPVGKVGHGPGPVIGQWGQQDYVPGQGELPLIADSVMAMEFLITRQVTEWENRTLWVGMEEDVIIGPDGAKIIGEPRLRARLV